jgi:transcriptional regulator of arginine metabolism
MRSRDRLILDIIAQRPIGTQDDLVEALRSTGIEVTQATVSRDIRRLGLIKVPAGGGAYRYQAPNAARPQAREVEGRLRRAFDDYVESIDEGSGLILVKTASGSAGTVAEAIDEMSWKEVVGTVAGDNTIIIVSRRPAMRAAVLARLRGLL